MFPGIHRPSAVLWVAFFAVLAHAQNLPKPSPPACLNPVAKCNIGEDYFPVKITIEYATASIRDVKFENSFVDFKVVEREGKQFSYRLVRCGCPPGTPPPMAQVIYVPPRKVHVADGVVLGMLTHSLSVGDRISAVDEKKFIYAPGIRKGVENGEIKDLKASSPKGNRYVQIRGDMSIDVSFLNRFQVEAYENASTGKPFLLSGESEESTPLGRSEWIKIFGLVFNNALTANDRFKDIRDQYEFAKRLAARATRRPSVLLNHPTFGKKKTVWNLPSERQYTTALLRDANVDYLYMNDSRNTTIEKSIEEVVKKFKWARYYIRANPFPPAEPTMESYFESFKTPEQKRVLQQIKTLASVRCGNVYSDQKRLSADKQANDYFEFGVARPDLMLQDMVLMFHEDVDVGGEKTFVVKYKEAPSRLQSGGCPYNDLSGAAAPGKRFVDTEMNITGMNRFQVEEKLVEGIIPELAKQLENIDAKSIEGYFKLPPPRAKASNFVVRVMASDAEAESFLRKDAVVPSVQKALGIDATVTWVRAKYADGETPTKSSNLATGAIIGAVLGVLAIVVFIAFLVYVVGNRRGRRSSEEALRERFWNEHQVRLSDDPEV